LNAPQIKARLLRDPVHLFATGFGSGLSPYAPGTAGSLLALAPCVFLLGLSWQWKAAIAASVFVAGVWICGASARRLGIHDHPGIVLDEIAAMLTITLFIDGGWPWVVPAFVIFRFFDIVKPWPIRDLDHRLSGGLGIMLDDQMAALYTGICLVAAQRIVATA
jgi:phosphatidylglycerophosphatase A